jgi:uncharacterized membrane protein YccC
MVSFICGFALGIGIAIWIWLKNKWARDELTKEKAINKTQEAMNAVLRRNIPKSRLDRLDALNKIANGSNKLD